MLKTSVLHLRHKAHHINNCQNFKMHLQIFLWSFNFFLSRPERFKNAVFIKTLLYCSSHLNSTPPCSSTTPPCSSTTPPCIPTTPPCSSTTPPCSSTTLPCSSTTPPCSSTTPPCSSTTPPCSSTTPTLKLGYPSLQLNYLSLPVTPFKVESNPWVFKSWFSPEHCNSSVEKERRCYC